MHSHAKQQQNLTVPLKTQNTKVWSVFWKKSFKNGNLGNTCFWALQYRAEIFGILMTESAESLLALWGVLQIWDAAVHGSITCWNGFSTSRDNPSFDAYSLGHISLFHTGHSRLCNAYFSFPECVSALADIIALIWLKWHFSFMNFSLA